MDESNVLDTSFLERLNTLLANGEVPGLFEGDELTTLMTQCKEGAQRDGLMLDTQEELYKWFTGQVIYNLHVVFTMNPSADGLKDRAATSPALFNRCVLVRPPSGLAPARHLVMSLACSSAGACAHFVALSQNKCTCPPPVVLPPAVPPTHSACWVSLQVRAQLVRRLE